MNNKQLKAAIKMGRYIANGKVDIVALDNKSLELRGKKQKSAKTQTTAPTSSEKGSRFSDKQVEGARSNPNPATKSAQRGQTPKAVKAEP
jgi:hypothetical protein